MPDRRRESGDITSQYFSEPPADPANDRVRVRRGLSDGLHDVGFIAELTLEAFRDADFLFDHDGSADH
jgi:hypothetical protein